MRFVHMADVHLGGWKQQPLQDLNFASFQKAIEETIKLKPDFLLIAGDLFDSAYPPIEILKETFAEFRKLKDAKIPCFIIAGSHDSSVSGRTFLDVLEKAGFCKNVTLIDDKLSNENKILLNPVVYKNVAIYGYPGRMSGLEIPDLRKVQFNDTPGFFKIFMLHTTLDKAVGSLPIESIEMEILPKADYYALGHLHIDFIYENFVYPGPIFPNNFQELEDLHHGGFYFIDTELNKFQRIELPIKKVETINILVKDANIVTDKIIGELEKRDIKDKIILLRLKGEIENGKTSDIKFQKIDDFARMKGAYFVLKNIHDLKTQEVKLDFEVKESENIEEKTIKIYSKENDSKFNDLIPQLMNTLSIEKQEGETNDGFVNRLIDESKKVLGF